MIGKILRKILGFKSKKEEKQLDKKGNIKEEFSVKISNVVNLLSQKSQEVKVESKVIVERLKDLHSTNYQLALKLLKEGSFGQAAFRFKVVRKFWPENYDAHLGLIYCYFLLGREDRAGDAIDYLLSLNPDMVFEVEEIKREASFAKNNQ